MARYRHKK